MRTKTMTDGAAVFANVVKGKQVDAAYALSKKLGRNISQSYVSRYSRGLTIPREPVLAAIERLWGIPASSWRVASVQEAA